MDGVKELQEGRSQVAEKTAAPQQRTEAAPPVSASSPPAPVTVPAETEPIESAQKITIVNKIPSTVISVLKQQFRLMNKWMQPIHEATQDQRAEMFELRNQLEECIDMYRKLIRRIERDDT